jgi:hypothetical protein
MEFRVMCCESQDISSGMRKIENWSDQFGTEIALRQGIFVQGYSVVTREVWVWICQRSKRDGQLLWFDGVNQPGTDGEKVHGARGTK